MTFGTDQAGNYKQEGDVYNREHSFPNSWFGGKTNTQPMFTDLHHLYPTDGYVNNKRMEYAVMLIKQHPEYSLGAISEACGIKSPATFIRNFKNAYGMTPSEFRKQLDEDELPPPFINN